MYTDYRPTETCNDKTESAVDTWKALPPETRQALAIAFKPLVESINRHSLQGVREKGSVELIGKVAMLVANRKLYINPALLVTSEEMGPCST